MTFLSILETLLLGPLKLSFEIIFFIAYRIVFHPGAAIFFLSLVVNILVLPLYRRADAMQEAARDTEVRLRDGAAHIKKTFSGDERMMILQTYYRQNHYKPANALSGSVSLLLQIPFFIAAYQFLSRLEIFQGCSLGPIADLSMPDGLLVIGGASVNLLPILMTSVNVLSGMLYLKGYPLKNKIQVYGMAMFFLVFLYTSPAGLVLYWTLNNVFSLAKNIFYKLNNPQKVVRPLCAGTGVVLLGLGGIAFSDSFKRKVFVMGAGLLILLLVFLPTLKKALPFRNIESRSNQKLFLLGSVFLTILTGLLIPSAVIASSPQEFVDITYFYHPLWYIVSAFCMAVGTFLIWARVFYWLASPTGKRLFEQIAWVLCGVALINYMFFGTDLGIISSSLQYAGEMSFSPWQQMTNVLILMAATVALYFCVCRWESAAVNVLVIFIIALGAMSSWHLITIKTSVDKIPVRQLSESDAPCLRLSTKGKNVIVLMLDRAMGEYIPYAFNEKPELKEQFDGFTYYGNTISFGGHTVFGASAMFGGYEYTPVEMNKRGDEPLASKHIEARNVMPAIFHQSGYEVTVCDTPVNIDSDAGGGASRITAYTTDGWFTPPEQKAESVEKNLRDFFCFSIMKSMPLFLQPFVYDYGSYIQPNSSVIQIRAGLSKASGIDKEFITAYQVLLHLPDITQVTTNAANTFLILYNNTAHAQMLLQEPDYTPARAVDNAAYDVAHADRFVIDGRELKMEVSSQVTFYHTNMAAMLRLGDWFDYLRENNVYDNTRIILVSDHGTNLAQHDELMMGDEKQTDVEGYYPLLMVKDFESKGFSMSDTFMTNADVPALAMRDIIQNPVNPFTGKVISDDEKNAHDQLIILSDDMEARENSGNTFVPSAWASVRDNIWDKNNWVFYDGPVVLDEHALP